MTEIDTHGMDITGFNAFNGFDDQLEDEFLRRRKRNKSKRVSRRTTRRTARRIKKDNKRISRGKAPKYPQLRTTKAPVQSTTVRRGLFRRPIRRTIAKPVAITKPVRKLVKKPIVRKVLGSNPIARRIIRPTVRKSPVRVNPARPTSTVIRKRYVRPTSTTSRPRRPMAPVRKPTAVIRRITPVVRKPVSVVNRSRPSVPRPVPVTRKVTTIDRPPVKRPVTTRITAARAANRPVKPIRKPQNQTVSPHKVAGKPTVVNTTRSQPPIKQAMPQALKSDVRATVEKKGSHPIKQPLAEGAETLQKKPMGKTTKILIGVGIAAGVAVAYKVLSPKQIKLMQ